MILPQIVKVSLVARMPTALCARTMATGTASDPIQKLFVDKIREYNQKASSSPDGLVDADEATRRALKEDFERVKRNFLVKDGEEGKITASFNDASFKIDPINQKDW